MCVCVCERERERERVSVCCLCVCVYVCVFVNKHTCTHTHINTHIKHRSFFQIADALRQGLPHLTNPVKDIKGEEVVVRQNMCIDLTIRICTSNAQIKFGHRRVLEATDVNVCGLHPLSFFVFIMIDKARAKENTY
jgi:hypothetical protein